MAKLHHVVITALKDDVFVETKRAKQPYKFDDNASASDDYRAKKDSSDKDQVHGIKLAKDQAIEIDVTDKQLAAIRAAVDAGDVEADGIPDASSAPSAQASSIDAKSKSVSK